MARRFPVLVALAMAAVAAVFAPALWGEFVYDDHALLARNPALHSPDGVLDLVTQPLWPGLDYWRPLTGLVLSAGLAAGDGGPLVVHGVALTLHLVAMWALYALVRRCGDDRVLALAAATLFALHPVQVESVAWASAVNDVLWGACALVGGLAFVRWRQGGSRGLPWGATVAFALALAAKEAGVVTLALYAVLDAVGRTGVLRWPTALLRAYGPAVVVLLCYLGLRAVVVGSSVGVQGSGVAADLEWARALTLRAELLGRFAGLFVMPAPLVLFRGIEVAPDWTEVTTWLPIVAAGAVVVGVWWACRSGCRPAGVGALWFLVALAPALAFADAVGPYPLADRYLYVAVAGGATAVMAALGALPAVPRRAAAVALVLLAAFGTSIRIGAWADQSSWVAAAVAGSPEDPRAQFMHGRLLLEGSQRLPPGPEQLAQVDRARAAFEAAERALGGSRYAARSLRQHLAEQVAVAVGWCIFARDPRGAQESFAESVRRWPASSPAHVGWGVTLGALGQLDPAQSALERAVQLDPLNAEAHHNLGQVHRLRGDTARAEASFAESARIRGGSGR